MCARLIQNISPQTFVSRFAGIKIVPNVSTRLDGMISSLTREHGGNIHERGIVAITSFASFTGSSCHAAIMLLI
jgi:hypothetical protein